VHRSILLPVAGVWSLIVATLPAIGHPLMRPVGSAIVRVADLDQPRHRRHHPRFVYWGERFTPGQHWQPWAPGRHHRYWHGGVTSAFCYGILSVAEMRCRERDWAP
jgi:hypothetical protein